MHFLIEVLGSRLAIFVVEAFPAIGSIVLGASGLQWLKHLRKHVHDKPSSDCSPN